MDPNNPNQQPPPSQQPPGGGYYYQPPPGVYYVPPQHPQPHGDEHIRAFWGSLSPRSKMLVLIIGLLLLVALFWNSCQSVHEATRQGTAVVRPLTPLADAKPRAPSVSVIEAQRAKAQADYDHAQQTLADTKQQMENERATAAQIKNNGAQTGGITQDPNKEFWLHIRQDRWKREAEAPYTSGLVFAVKSPNSSTGVSSSSQNKIPNDTVEPTSATSDRPMPEPPPNRHDESDRNQWDIRPSAIKEADSEASYDVADGPQHQLDEGTIIDLTLMNELDGEFTGPVICVTGVDVYDASGLHLLVPAGSKVLGEAQQVGHQNQRRLGVVFHAIIMPDHFRINLDKYPALDQIGAMGLHDRVDNHFLTTFLMAGAVGAISGLSQIGNSAVSYSPIYGFRQGVSEQEAQSSEQILSRYLNRYPTMTVRPGRHRVKLYLRAPISFYEYANHHMPVNF